MAVLDILTYPDSRLKKISRPIEVIDEDLQQFISDLEETMLAGPTSAGVAAPQVGRFERLVLIDVSFKPNIPNHGRLVLINPEIIFHEGAIVGREGCLSVPDYTGNVSRFERIHLKALDQAGETQDYDMFGYEARAVQHELDHLDGLLFLDRLVSRRNSLFRRKVHNQVDLPKQ